MTAPSNILAPARSDDDWAGDYERLLRERDDLSRRLNDALGRLAASDAGAFSLASPGDKPQHDQLAQRFRHLKLQDFQALSFSLYSIWQKKPGSSATRATAALAYCRQLLAEELLVEGSKRLAIRQTGDLDADLHEITQAIFQSIRARLKMRNNPPAELADRLQETIVKSLSLLQAMAAIRPAACLLVPRDQTAFLPELHEPMIGSPGQGAITVRLTVFPGYLVTGSNRVLERALVQTEAAANKD